MSVWRNENVNACLCFCWKNWACKEFTHWVTTLTHSVTTLTHSVTCILYKLVISSGSMPSHYMNQCELIWNCTSETNLSEIHSKIHIFIFQQNAFENVCKLAAISYRPQSVSQSCFSIHASVAFHWTNQWHYEKVASEIACNLLHWSQLTLLWYSLVVPYAIL